MEIVLLGHMGRDDALADRLVQHGHKLHVIGQWLNPGLLDKSHQTGGGYYTVDSLTNTDLVTDIVSSVEPDIFVTNSDDALAAGVVDAMALRIAEGRMKNLLLPSPDKEAFKIESDKFDLRQLVDEVCPEYNPLHFLARSEHMAADYVDFFEDRGVEVAIKPRNLTGGKGVKVQGKNLTDHQAAKRYCFEVLAKDNQSGVEVQEKIEAPEFTLQIFTDGNVIVAPPVTYDYPYRKDGDRGPGTGGMGSFTMGAGEQLPFLTEADYDEALGVVDKLLPALREEGRDFKGILYPTFFKTNTGLKLVEINARGGDPELINILDLLEDNVDIAEVLKDISNGNLDSQKVRFKKAASAMIYLVSPEYGGEPGPIHNFNLNTGVIEAGACRIRFAATEKIVGNKYRTVGSSRTVGLSALARTPWDARQMIHEAIDLAFEGDLEYRQDIADKKYIESLKVIS